MTESIQTDLLQTEMLTTRPLTTDVTSADVTTEVTPGVTGTTLCAERPAQSTRVLDFWHFAAEQYGIWLDAEQWCELAGLDDHLLVARRYFWRLSDPEVHELLCAVPTGDE